MDQTFRHLGHKLIAGHDIAAGATELLSENGETWIMRLEKGVGFQLLGRVEMPRYQNKQTKHNNLQLMPRLQHQLCNLPRCQEASPCGSTKIPHMVSADLEEYQCASDGIDETMSTRWDRLALP